MSIDYTAYSFVCDEEYMAMENMVNVLTDVVKRTYSYNLEASMEEFEIDRMIDRVCADKVEEAVLAFYEVTREELDEWIAKNAEVAHWVTTSAQTAESNFPELDEFVEEYDPNAAELVAA